MRALRNAGPARCRGGEHSPDEPPRPCLTPRRLRYTDLLTPAAGEITADAIPAPQPPDAQTSPARRRPGSTSADVSRPLRALCEPRQARPPTLCVDVGHFAGERDVRCAPSQQSCPPKSGISSPGCSRGARVGSKSDPRLLTPPSTSGPQTVGTTRGPVVAAVLRRGAQRPRPTHVAPEPFPELVPSGQVVSDHVARLTLAPGGAPPGRLAPGNLAPVRFGLAAFAPDLPQPAPLPLDSGHQDRDLPL